MRRRWLSLVLLVVLAQPTVALAQTPGPTPSPSPPPDVEAPVLDPRMDGVPKVRLGSRRYLANVRVHVSERARVDLWITRRDGSGVIRLRKDAHVRRGIVVTRWPGGKPSGRLVRPGRYLYAMRATDLAGNSSEWLRGPVRAVAGSYASSATRRVTYTVERRGVSRSKMPTFRHIAKLTFADVRGWSLRWNIHFRRVTSNGDFRLILASPSAVAAAHPVCSSNYSCRVGDQALINVFRWMNDTPSWTKSRRAYRSYVINHEVGHWLGLGHEFCPRTGALAPVMQQQSKSLQGCRANVWPLVYERSAVARIHGIARWPLPPAGSPCTIVGTDGRDLLSGTSESDVMCGFGGRDRLRARSGNDVLFGGGGVDSFFGGPGLDVTVDRNRDESCTSCNDG